jgi:uncharacterized membrane protein
MAALAAQGGRRHGPGMDRWVRAAALLALALGMAGCGERTGGGGDAATAAQALLTAVQTGDARAFEAHLDRPALRANLRAQLQMMAAANGLDVAGGAADFALDRMIAPEAFRLVRSQDGAQVTTAPTLSQVTALMTPLAKDRACLHDFVAPQRCLLTFTRHEDSWHLVAMPAYDLRIVVPPEPPAKS